MLLWLISLCWLKALPEAFTLNEQAAIALPTDSARVSAEVGTGFWNL